MIREEIKFNNDLIQMQLFTPSYTNVTHHIFINREIGVTTKNQDLDLILIVIIFN